MKNSRVVCINESRAELVLPISMISSAKNKEAIFMGPRSMPSPDEFRVLPRLLIKIENSRGLRLQPVKQDCCNYVYK